MALPTLLTMGREEAEQFTPGPDDLCISIRSPRASHVPRLRAGWREVLSLVFDDAPVGDPSGEAVQLSDDQADAVVALLERHPNAHRLVIHCEVGLSRSVSMAMAIAHAHGAVYRPWWMKRYRIPNRRVYRAVTRAFERRGAGGNAW